MGSENYSNIIILCEDRHHEVFAKTFLEIFLKVNPNRIRAKSYPNGKGAGEQSVRENYLKEVKAYRSAKNKQNIALVLIIDADKESVAKEQATLDEKLDKANVAARDRAEAIAIFIPKRNIETWLCFLDGQKIDETTDSKKQWKKTIKDIKPLVRQLAEDCKQGKALAETAPESLKVACEELQRLPKF